MKEKLITTSYIIKDMETLRAIADPLRIQILELLVHEPMTVKQVAEKLGLAPGKLYYHFNQLEKHGLIQVAESRQVANLIEKLYRATASTMDIDPALLTFTTEQGKESINTLVATMLDSTKDDLLRSLQARTFHLERGASPQPRRAIINRVISRVSEDRAAEFSGRIESLLKEFDAADEGIEGQDNDLQTYALTLAFYPSFFFEDDQGVGID
jgi:DNA-binding transcriptional ArsR family regulator